MQLSQEQFNALVGAAILLMGAIAAYLNNQSSKRAKETQAKIDQLHATVVGQQPPGPLTPTLVDGHTTSAGYKEHVPWETPAKPKA